MLTKLRARDHEEKMERRQQLIEATEAVLKTRSPQEFSVAEVAKAAGLAKGTLYLYFASKEELLLSLIDKYFDEWFTHIEAALHTYAETKSLEKMLEEVVAYLQFRPQFMELLELGHGVLEPKLPAEVLVPHKQKIAQNLDRLAEASSQLFENVSKEDAGRLWVNNYALILGVWQMSNPPVVIREKLFEEPMLIPLVRDFASELVPALVDYWQGSLMRLQNTPKPHSLRKS